MKRHIKNLFSNKNNSSHVIIGNNLHNQSDDVIHDSTKALCALTSSIARGDIRKVKNLLDYSNIDIDALNSQGMTSLFFSLKKRDFAIMELLINYGADPDIKNSEGEVPWNYAFGLCNTQFAKKLIASGANLYNYSPDGELPLHTATRYGRIDLVEMLVKRNADIEAVSKQGYKALDLGILNMNHHTSMTLVKYGAKISNDNLKDVSTTQRINAHEYFLYKLITTAAKLDCVDDDITKEIHNHNNKIFKSYNKLDISSKVVLTSRLVYQVYWNKKFSAPELTVATDKLIAKMNYLNDNIGLELSSWVYVLMNKYESISSEFLTREEGGVPSLFKLTADFMKKKNLWNSKLMEKSHPDIVDRLKIIDNAYEFIEKFHIILQSKSADDIDSKMEIVYDNNQDSMELVGDEERYDFMETDWVLS